MGETDDGDDCKPDYGDDDADCSYDQMLRVPAPLLAVVVAAAVAVSFGMLVPYEEAAVLTLQ